MKRSALFHLHQRSGAVLGEYHGWAMAASFETPEAEAAAVRASAGLADVSYRAKFDGKNAPERNGWMLGARHYLTAGDPPLEAPPGATEVTSVYANLLLAGPKSRAVLGKLTSLRVSDDRLPNGACAQTSLAHVHAILLREDLPQTAAYHVLISREYAESVWEAMLHAGQEYHLRPFGWKALELLKA